MKRSAKGFTLIEMLVVVSIIAILSAVLFASMQEAATQSRDAKRQSDLRLMQNAIELYKNKYDRYPEGCNGTGWSGEVNTLYECSDGTGEYIRDLAPEFIPVLPIDPRRNGDDSGYVYRVNADGSVYKIIALNTVELNSVVDNSLAEKIIPELDSFKLCPADNSPNDTADMLCSTVVYCSYDQDEYQNSYALWGGYGNTSVSPTSGSYDNLIKTATEAIVCAVPGR